MAKFSTDKVVKLQGKEFVLFEGLLEVAHEHCHLSGIETTIIQLPTHDVPVCIVTAKVTTEKNQVFTGIGDASPANVGKMIVPHLIRMAETRAIARALRFLTGFGTAFEELGDLSEQPQETHKKPVQSVPAPQQAQAPKSNKEVVKGQLEQAAKVAEIEAATGTPVTEEEIRELFGADIEVVMADEPPITENELKRIKGKIQSCKPSEGKHYGVIYGWIGEAAGIQVKTKDDLPKITQDRLKAVLDLLDSKAGHFEKVAV
jgi:hypothetical protein